MNKKIALKDWYSQSQQQLGMNCNILVIHGCKTCSPLEYKVWISSIYLHFLPKEFLNGDLVYFLNSHPVLVRLFVCFYILSTLQCRVPLKYHSCWAASKCDISFRYLQQMLSQESSPINFTWEPKNMPCYPFALLCDM